MSRCQSCGQPLTDQNSKNKPSSTKRFIHKKLWLSALFVSLLLTGIYIANHIHTDKEKLIAEVEASFQAKDAGNLSTLLSSSDSRLKINEDNTEILLDYLSKKPEYTQTIIAVLHEQARLYDKAEKSSVYAASDQQAIMDGFFTLKRHTHSFFFDTYSIEIDPVYLTVHTNSKDAALSINGHEIIKKDEQVQKKTVGPFLPGEYKVEATLQNNKEKRKQKKTVVLWNNHAEVDVNL